MIEQPVTQKCRDCAGEFPYHPDADYCPDCVAEMHGPEAAAEHPAPRCARRPTRS
jgi:Zn finger protein HypA/HybF involved in hydrogenase expression